MVKLQVSAVNNGVIMGAFSAFIIFWSQWTYRCVIVWQQ